MDTLITKERGGALPPPSKEGGFRAEDFGEEDIPWNKDEDQREVLTQIMEEFGEGEVGERDVVLYYWW